MTFNTRIIKMLPDTDLVECYWFTKKEMEKELTTQNIGRIFEEIVRESTLRGLCPMGESK